MTNNERMDIFMAVSYMYLKVSDKSSRDLSSHELEELIVAINDNHESDFYSTFYLV